MPNFADATDHTGNTFSTVYLREFLFIYYAARVSGNVIALPEEIGADWISPSSTRNYIKGDPILDWLDYYGMRQDEQAGTWSQKQDFFHGFWPDSRDPNYIRETDFGRFIMQKGKDFEDRVTNLINENLIQKGFPPIVRVARTSEEIRSVEALRKTFDLLDEAHPVISQPVLWDEELKIYGSPDLLVRSDVLNHIIGGSISDDDADVKAPNIGCDRHYVVVDIKFTGLDFLASGELGGKKEHYKVQVALYTAALAKMQGYLPTHGYLIGRAWKDHKKNRGDSCLDRIGRFCIEPQRAKQTASWIDAAKPACDWVRRMKREGREWTAQSAIEVPELRPNMSNLQDAPYHRAKRQIAEETGELTQLWNVGVQKRDAFISERNSADWKHDECTPENLGVSSSIGERLGRILNVNRDPDGYVSPKEISWAREEWITPQPVEFFVDFETCNDLNDDFSRLPKKGGQSLIFMIGCGHIENGEWMFKCFTATECTPESEIKIIHQWRDHMVDVKDRVDHKLRGSSRKNDIKGQFSLFDPETQFAALNPPVFHWSPAEQNTLIGAYDSALARHGEIVTKPNFYDFLNNVIKPQGTNECVVVKGAFNFGLKAIGKALHALGLIKTEWKDGPTDGLGAMTGAWWCYREAVQKQIPVTEVETLSGRKLFQEIIRYNEIDCRVMFEAIDYLRRVH